MNNIINYKDYNLNVILLDEIFQQIQIKFLNTIHSLIINNYIIMDRDVKRYFLHHLIKETCDYLQTKHFVKNKVLFIQSSFADNDYDLWKYIEKEKIVDIVMKTFKQIKLYLPLPVYINSNSINLEHQTGELIDLLNILQETINTHNQKCLTTKHLRKYSEKNGLVYLTNTYLVSGEFKKLLYNA